MTVKRYRCWHCDAEYQLRWDLDADYYVVMYCAFCGESINDDDDYSTDEEE
jgi:DNA-directed RNA polymerase subunit RPC12/RpoP